MFTVRWIDGIVRREFCRIFCFIYSHRQKEVSEEGELGPSLLYLTSDNSATLVYLTLKVRVYYVTVIVSKSFV